MCQGFANPRPILEYGAASFIGSGLNHTVENKGTDMPEVYEVAPLGLNLRDAPGIEGAVVTVLTRGDTVEKLGASERAGWWQVRASVGRIEQVEGYLAARHVVKIDPPEYNPPWFGFGGLKASFKRVSDFVGAYADRFDETALPNFNKVLSQYGINKSRLRFRHFMAQVAHESAHFSRLEENLNYSASGLRKVFGKYFPTDADAEAYARQPEKIANRVYANRMKNGDEASGDGWRYRGRGFIQLTGRENYQTIGAKLGLPLEEDPDAVSRDAVVALRVACAFWESRNLNRYADKDDINEITRRINGGTNGLTDRKRLLERAKKIWPSS